MKYLQAKVKYLRTEICRLRKKGKYFKTRLANAEKLSINNSFLHVTRNMSKPAQLFMHMQLQEAKHSKGRRFTEDEKVLSLSLYKKSPKAYGLLYKYFTLPSIKAMKRLLAKLTICQGINSVIFEKIKKTIIKKDPSDRLCSLIFDEMSITPNVFYNVQKDALQGFAYNNSLKFATHVLVFMVKGIKQNFKQPVAYYFTAGLNKFDLKNLVKIVIKQLINSGLIIINTVCDQSTVNVGAITELIRETKESFVKLNREWTQDMFHVNKHKIIPLYDVPHLIKGIRNNLITKDMLYYIDNTKKIVKWEYYQQVYAADKSYGELRLLHKLTEEHVNPAKINKMRVKLATQLFSHSTAVVAEHLSARGDLPTECRDLTQITLLLDNLFDSLNVNTLHIPNGKIYKGPIRRNSPHHQLWQKAKEILKTVKFILKKNTTGNKTRIIETIVPSVTNLIHTIKGFEAIWKSLSEIYKYDCMLTRHFNQDPVENFFGNIRSYGVRNNAPNTVSFEGAYKALLLNNYSMPQSKGANCEEDANECLQNLRFFLNERPKIITPDVPVDDIINFNEDLLIETTEVDAGQKQYVCGWVLRKCLKKIVKGCAECKSSILENSMDNINNNNYIKAKEYNMNKKWLCYPSSEVETCFQKIQHITSNFLKKKI